MNMVVTGAGGFVGRNLIDCLIKNGNTVTAVDIISSSGIKLLPNSDKIKVVAIDPDSDIESLQQLLKGIDSDVMFHLAWVGAGGPMRADYTIQLNNVKKALDYYTVADRIGCKKFIAVGTIGEYMAELAAKNNIHSENFIYATCKRMTHSLLEIVENRGKCKAVWATLGGLYGIGDSTNNLVNYTIRTLLNNEKPTFGPAQQPSDFINIKDCVRALQLIAVSDTVSKHFYIGSGEPRVLEDYLTTIAKCVNNGIDVGVGERPDDGTIYLKEWFDISDLKNETGFVPEYTFEKGIEELLNWITESKKG